MDNRVPLIENAEEYVDFIKLGLQTLCETEDEKFTLIRWMIERGFVDEGGILEEGDMRWPYVWTYTQPDENGNDYYCIEASSQEQDELPCVLYSYVKHIVEGESASEFPIGKITKWEFDKALNELLKGE